LPASPALVLLPGQPAPPEPHADGRRRPGLAPAGPPRAAAERRARGRSRRVTAAPAPDPLPVARALALAGPARSPAAARPGRAPPAAAGGLPLPRLRGAILAALAPRLAGDLPAAALTLARDLPDAWARATALAALLPYLPPSRRARALDDLLAAA